MTSYPQITRAFYFEPLALEESQMLAIHMFLWPRITGQLKDFNPDIQQAQKDGAPATNRMGGSLAHMRRQMAGPEMQSNGPFSAPTLIDERYYWSADGHPDTAVIPLNGMISKGAGLFAEMCMGVTNPDRISHALGQALAAKDVKNIVFDMGTPGGRTTYIPELSAQIKAAKDTRGKTLYAFTDTMIASAGMWLAGQCDEIICTGSSGLGSIGTYMAFLNPKVAMQTQGYSLELFSKGTHKALGLPGKDLTQADREYLQGIVDKLNAQFVSAMQSGRPKASEEALRDAKMYDGPDAIKHGLADGLVSTWDEFLSLL
jgi:ClpP class serine protease